jgi:hypothetical protein
MTTDIENRLQADVKSYLWLFSRRVYIIWSIK